ncbi:MAG: hypothetical protein H6716_04775 [Polyangiaceae bacterium]|nr:hypothetical protein [Polyangiaceae bacterium]
MRPASLSRRSGWHQLLSVTAASLCFGGVSSVTTPAAAAPEPPTPSFGAAIDGFADYNSQSTCDPSEKPGAKDFRSLMLATYPVSSNLGIIRACNVGGTSEHKEGRAFDWGLNYNDANQRDIASTAINWLLKTDEHGNACALARRFGLMYFIWNKQIWGSYRSPNGSCATAGWKAYTGSNPHTDHIHLSWAWPGARQETTWWTSPLPSNQPPKGYLDTADCESVGGWSQDVDTAGSPNDVHLYFDGPAGDAAATSVALTADQYREDLCGALGSCEHAYEVASPLSLHDGQEHSVYAYGIDTSGGANSQLTNSPKSFRCEPNVPSGVLRHVTSQDVFATWGFSYFWDVMPVSDAELQNHDPGDDVVPAPVLAKSDDGSPAVYLIDGDVKRHIPSPAVMDAWGFDWNSIEVWQAADLAALEQGPDVRARPVLIQASGPGVYLLDDDWGAPPGTGGGTGGGGGGGGSWASGGAGGADETGGVAGSNSAEGGSGVGPGTRVLSDDSGCSCSTAGKQSQAPSGLLWFALAGVSVALTRRRRTR